MAYFEYSIQLINKRTQSPINDDTGICNVLTADSPAEATIYSNTQGTAASNPGTFTDGKLTFYTTQDVTSVDVSIVTANGEAIFIDGLTPDQHRVEVDTEKTSHRMVIPYTYSGASETVVDSGFDWAANMAMKDVLVYTPTLGTGMVLQVGTSTTINGFIISSVGAATGLKAMPAETSGIIGTFLCSASATNSFLRYGSLRANATSGANICYTNTTSSTTVGSGYIYLYYEKIHSL